VIKAKTRRWLPSFLVLSLLTFLLQIPSSHTSSSAAEANPGIVATFQNFYAPAGGATCPNGIATVARPDNKPFIEFDNFSLTVSNSKKLVLGSSIYSTFATEDGKKRIELPVKICGDDRNYLGQTEVYTLQIKFISADRKFGQEIAIDFTLIPIDEKAKAAQVVRDTCPSTGTGGSPYFVNWNIEKSSKVREGKTFNIAGTLYRYGYPADLEPIKVIKKSYSPYREILIASGTTDKDGKFKLAWKVNDNGIHMMVVEERIRPVGPYYGTFASMEMPIWIHCFGDCKYAPGPSNASWEGKPAKSTGQCAIAKHEYSLVAPSPAISSSGSADRDRNLWFLGLIAVKNSLKDSSVLQSKETSAYVADPTSSTNYTAPRSGSGSGISSGGGGGGSVWVSGHMRNGKYVKGYSRRKG
jgi:hypothetical protein